MTNEQILKKAIEKAEKNGFNSVDFYYDYGGIDFDTNDVSKYIFSHDFAKAFWGEERIIDPNFYIYHNGEYFSSEPKEWAYHLRQMVLEKEPLKYLEKFIKEDK